MSTSTITYPTSYQYPSFSTIMSTPNSKKHNITSTPLSISSQSSPYTKNIWPSTSPFITSSPGVRNTLNDLNMIDINSSPRRLNMCNYTNNNNNNN